ncbi:MAG: putative rane protein [Deltaproteobacteria bacterium]|nr:putative rane protein [Deltaproteobacteria bacterium]
MEFLKRRISQGIGAVLPNAYVQGFLSASLYQGPLKNACTPLLNCYACPSALLSCPIGTMQHFMATRTVPFYAIGTLSVVGASVGRMTCGTLCPFGALQDLLYKFPSFKLALPPRARYLRYVALVALVFAIPFVTGEHWFSKLCPVGTLIAGIPWATMNAGVRAMIGSLFWVKISILLLFVSLSAMAKRPFCRAACPLGAIFSLFNKTSFLQLAWNPDTCTRCGKCRKICPVDIRPDRNATDPECLRCLDCTLCPSLKATTVFHRHPFAPAIPRFDPMRREGNI